MTYAGLTTADKGALEKAKRDGLTMCWIMSVGKPVNIDLALAQIAEMESKENKLLSEKASEKPCMTWSERINQMTVEEKSETFVVESSVMLDIGSGKKEYPIWITPLIDGVSFTSKEAAINYNKDHLNSPYTEGETENG